MKGHYLNPSLKDVSPLFRETNWRQRKQAHFPLMTKKVFATQTWDSDSHPSWDTLTHFLFITLTSSVQPLAGWAVHMIGCWTNFIQLLWFPGFLWTCCCIIHRQSSWQAVGVLYCMCSQQVMAAVVIRPSQVHWKAVGRLYWSHSIDRSRLEQ